MKFEKLIKILGSQALFDLASVVQLSSENRETLKTQLYRWCRDGQLISLRRGGYAFSAQHRKRDPNPAELANRILSPSYLSTQWAMGFHGLIPEKVVVYTSITSRGTKIFVNDFGHQGNRARYSENAEHIHQDRN
jgi:hypothetical protein